jgi:hypothetical protein
MAKQTSERFYLAVKRNYEDIWRLVSEFTTRQEAEDQMTERRGWTGAFNYDNAELRVISTGEAKAEFGSDWHYKPLGSKAPAPATTTREKKAPARRKKRPADDD